MHYYKNKYSVGILLPREKNGGCFQLALSIADSLLKYSHKFAYTILYYDEEMLKWLVNTDATSKLVSLKKRTEIQRFGAFVNILLHAKILPMSSRMQTSHLAEAGIDLLVVPFHSLIGFMAKMPYVITITSLQHKCHSVYPKGYPLLGRWQANVLVGNAAKQAVTSVVDSRMGRDDLSRCFGVALDKISIVPFIPAGYIYENAGMDLITAERILDAYGLPEKFIFYPAQFWHVKNHALLVRSLGSIVERHNVKVPLVLVGNPDEAYEEVMSIVKDLCMQDQVVHLGYVSDKTIVALYKKAVALVYPSLAGPTNLPPLEAMVLGTPVLCSDLFAMPEQVGDAGMLFDPFSVEDMAEKIYRTWTDASLRESLRQKGYQKVKDLTQENYARQWEDVIKDALRRIGKTA